jgi:hypothetical protein
VLAGLVASSPLKDKPDLNVLDMGSGKGYLTFAAYDHLAHSSISKAGEAEPLRRGVRMTGIEARRELVDLCNGVAQAGGFEGLSFVQGQISDHEFESPVDILIALHACDTATDDALYAGIAAKASIIIAAPCCHKEVRRKMHSPELLAGILKHGVMAERTAETVTDGLRALLLEASGYKAKLFEFVPTEHTPKNNMLVGTRSADRSAALRAREQADELIRNFGITDQRLNDLLPREIEKANTGENN